MLRIAQFFDCRLTFLDCFAAAKLFVNRIFDQTFDRQTD